MTTAIALPSERNAPLPSNLSQVTAVEQARAVAEVQAAVVVAQQVPRDVPKAIASMQQACSQKAMAIRAFYSVPRAGGRIEGSTVHLARELARCWGNVQYGISELRRDDAEGISEMQAWAWDVETNTRSSRSFIVPHDRMVGKGADKRRERLVDLGDIANNNNSVAARAVRETIFTILPTWFQSDAEDICTRTLQDGGGKTLAQQIADGVAYFANTFGVSRGQLEDRLQRGAKDWTPQDLGALQVLSGELARGEKQVADEFPSEQRRVTAADLGTPAEPQPETGEAITPDQSKKLHAQFRDLGYEKDRVGRLALSSRIVGRELASSSDLTKTEASALIDVLETALATADPQGHLDDLTGGA